MKASSAKNKGNRFENFLIERFRSLLDSRAQRTYGSGNGMDKGDIHLPNFDIEIEAKNQKTIKLIDWWEQTQRQRTDRTAVLILRNPRKPEFQESLVVMDLEEWIELVKKQNEETEVINNKDQKLKWKIKRLKDAAQEVFKDL